MNVRGRSFTFLDELPSTRFVIDNIETWEQDTFDTIDRYVHGGTFVDIGAWCGIFSLYASFVADRVLAFEPDPVAYDLLKRNIAANGRDNITPLNFAVWDHSDGVTLGVHSEGFGSSMTGPSRCGGLAVNCATYTPAQIRWLCEFDTVDLVKVDTEGSETHIVPGLIDWDVPIHLSIHVREMDGYLDYGGRDVVTLVEHHDYPVVLLP